MGRPISDNRAGFEPPSRNSAVTTDADKDEDGFIEVNPGALIATGHDIVFGVDMAQLLVDRCVFNLSLAESRLQTAVGPTSRRRWKARIVDYRGDVHKARVILKRAQKRAQPPSSS